MKMKIIFSICSWNHPANADYNMKSVSAVTILLNKDSKESAIRNFPRDISLW